MRWVRDRDLGSQTGDPRHASDGASTSTPVLPVQLLWIALLAAILLGSGPAAVVGDQSWDQAFYATAALCLPYLLITGTLIAFYRYLVPRWLPRIEARVLRLAFHGVCTAAVSVSMGVLLYPPYRAVDPEPLRFSDWLTVCVVNGWALTLPTLWVSHLSAEVERKRRLAAEAELAALHAQMNPHFLFNSLNTIASLIAVRPRDAETVVEQLADVLRHVLGTSPGELVPLRRELAFARNTLAIHEIRFEGSLTVEFDVDPRLEDRLVPSLLLAPLVENAILHGLAARGRGRIVVSASAGPTRWCVAVSDDGVGVGASPHRGHGTGLTHLRHRLALLYGGAAALELITDGSTTRAIVSLPAPGANP